MSSVELLETQLVNAIAPFVLNGHLKPLMLRTPERDKHVVNVSAVEGQFYRKFKTTRHPHTNMAKAALNMMTRTSATDYAADGIHMNSVDTGWVTDEDPVELAERKADEHRFSPPLDIVDGAARIVDPIIDGVQHRRARVGPVPEGLPADRLVTSCRAGVGPRRTGRPPDESPARMSGAARRRCDTDGMKVPGTKDDIAGSHQGAGRRDAMSSTCLAPSCQRRAAGRAWHREGHRPLA